MLTSGNSSCGWLGSLAVDGHLENVTDSSSLNDEFLLAFLLTASACFPLNR